MEPLNGILQLFMEILTMRKEVEDGADNLA